LESNLEIKENEEQKVINLQAEVPDPGAGQNFSVMLEMYYVHICSINAKGISNSGGFSWRIQTENCPEWHKNFNRNRNRHEPGQPTECIVVIHFIEGRNDALSA
jgi:hypothetical protein